jgi:large subunit ribosomal protein L29
MKSKDLNNLSSPELKHNLSESRKEMLKLNGQVSTGTNPKKPSQIRNTKKTIARILTILKKRGEKTE